MSCLFVAFLLSNAARVSQWVCWVDTHRWVGVHLPHLWGGKPRQRLGGAGIGCRLVLSISSRGPWSC